MPACLSLEVQSREPTAASSTAYPAEGYMVKKLDKIHASTQRFSEDQDDLVVTTRPGPTPTNQSLGFSGSACSLVHAEVLP